MQKKYRGILLFKKIYKDNDLYVKFLSNTDEIISGIIYGGLSKKKRNIYQNGFFLNLDISYISNRPPSISAELTKPYLSIILDDKYKLNCLLATISILNVAIIDGQKINKIFSISETFINKMISSDKWLISFLNYLFDLLKIIGYEIDYKDSSTKKFFDIESLEFKKNYSKSSIFFAHELLESNKITKKNYKEINDIFKIFEIVFVKNHLSSFNLHLPNQYQLFKKTLNDYFNTE